MKKLLAVLISLAIISSTFGQAVFAENDTSGKMTEPGVAASVQADLNTVKVYLNKQELDVSTILYDGKLYLPLRDLCYFLQGNISFDEKSKTIDILFEGTAKRNGQIPSAALKGNTDISILINPYLVKCGGINAYVNTILFEDTTFVSVRYISEIFGKKIEWNSDEKAVYLSDSFQDVVGNVNGEYITKREFDYFYNSELKEMSDYAKRMRMEITEEDMRGLKRKVMNSVINRKIIAQKAKENKITLSASEIDDLNRNLQKIIEGNGGIDKFREYLEGYGVYYIQVAQQHKQSLILNKLYVQLMKGVEAKPEAVKEYYEANKGKVLSPEMVRAKHILILTTDESRKLLPEDKLKEARRKAEEILAKIKAGEDFDGLMKTYSQDPGLSNAPNGYKFERGQMVREFENTAFSLEVGKVSGIIETDYGYHIIKLEERFPEKKLTLEEAKQRMDKSEKDNYVNALVDKWWTESEIENYIR